MLRLCFGAFVALSFAVSASAQDKKAAPKETPQPEPAKPAKGEVLPAPRPLAPPVVWGPYVLPNLPPEPGTREVWQYFAVDRSGRFQRRVILAPYGSYYLYNGQPYPWTTTRPELHMPYALD